MARTKRTTSTQLAKKLGIAASTVRSRLARGTPVNAKPQLRLTEAQQKRIARASGSSREVAEKFGCSPTTVKRLRRDF